MSCCISMRHPNVSVCGILMVSPHIPAEDKTLGTRVLCCFSTAQDLSCFTTRLLPPSSLLLPPSCFLLSRLDSWPCFPLLPCTLSGLGSRVESFGFRPGGEHDPCLEAVRGGHGGPAHARFRRSREPCLPSHTRVTQATGPVVPAR